MHAPSQWETTLHCNVVSHWLGAHTKWSLGTNIFCDGGYSSSIRKFLGHYDDVIMSAIASQITSLTIVYSTVYPGTDQSKHQSSASLAFVWGIHREPVNSPHKWPVTRKMFPFDDVIMVKGPWLTHWRYCTLVLIFDTCLSMNGYVDKRYLCGRCWRAYRINFMAILWSIYSGLRQSFWGKMADIIKLSTRDLHTMS